MTLPTLSRGGPDFGKQPAALAATQIDPGLASELTALGFSRLDSIGRPWWFDDFGGGIGGWNSGAFVTQAYGLSGYAASQCLRLTANATIFKDFSIPPSLRMGFETAIFVETVLPTQIIISLTTNLKSAQLRYGGGVWTILAGGVTPITVPGNLVVGKWAQVKVTADFLANTFLATITPSSTAPSVRTNVSANALGANITTGTELLLAANNGGVPVSVQFGYALLTVDEP